MAKSGYNRTQDGSWSVADQSWSVEPPPTNFFSIKSHWKLTKKSWSVANRKRVKRNFLLLPYFLSTDQLFYGSFEWDLVSKKLVGGGSTDQLRDRDRPTSIHPNMVVGPCLAMLHVVAQKHSFVHSIDIAQFFFKKNVKIAYRCCTSYSPLFFASKNPFPVSNVEKKISEGRGVNWTNYSPPLENSWAPSNIGYGVGVMSSLKS